MNLMSRSISDVYDDVTNCCTIRFLDREELLLQVAQPVQAGISQPVLQEMGVGGDTHHIQLVLLQQ